MHIPRNVVVERFTVKHHPHQNRSMDSASPTMQAACHINGSMTFSAGSLGVSNFTEPLELEVLKSILNREAYLMRLQSLTRKFSSTFQPEVADMVDITRSATLDVVENLVIWRQAKVRDFFCHKTLPLNDHPCPHNCREYQRVIMRLHSCGTARTICSNSHRIWIF